MSYVNYLISGLDEIFADDDITSHKFPSMYTTLEDAIDSLQESMSKLNGSEIFKTMLELKEVVNKSRFINLATYTKAIPFRGLEDIHTITKSRILRVLGAPGDVNSRFDAYRRFLYSEKSKLPVEADMLYICSLLVFLLDRRNDVILIEANDDSTGRMMTDLAKINNIIPQPEWELIINDIRGYVEYDQFQPELSSLSSVLDDMVNDLTLASSKTNGRIDISPLIDKVDEYITELYERAFEVVMKGIVASKMYIINTYPGMIYSSDFSLPPHGAIMDGSPLVPYAEKIVRDLDYFKEIVMSAGYFGYGDRGSFDGLTSYASSVPKIINCVLNTTVRIVHNRLIEDIVRRCDKEVGKIKLISNPETARPNLTSLLHRLLILVEVLR